MSTNINVLGIAGSLRKASYNRGLLRAAAELGPEGMTVGTFDIAGLPGFSQDEEKNPPAQVVELKKAIRAADAILFVTPEYNYSIPGVLKNAIDWASRPYGDSAWAGKPAAIMGASVGMLGSARAQYHLRQVCVTLDMHVLNKPEVMVAGAAGKFDAAGNLTDAETRKHVVKQLEALAAWVRRLGKG